MGWDALILTEFFVRPFILDTDAYPSKDSGGNRIIDINHSEIWWYMIGANSITNHAPINHFLDENRFLFMNDSWNRTFLWIVLICQE